MRSLTNRPARLGLVLAVAAATVTSTVVVARPAEASPERVLQAVDVEVGTDGRVDAITSRAVRQAGEDVSEDVDDLDAAELAGQLPVRVQTAWRLGERSGTDLADIQGESGRVVVELTVQNTTVRPEQVRYDAAGESRSRWALVGTPLTVVAAADLGDQGSVVLEDDLSPDMVTNGVLGHDDRGDSHVQWATMLAPPRLGASATLRLVQDTDDFQPPRFDLSVQPGLVTDTSLRRLLEAAFAEESSSTVSLETRTIELIGTVTGVLTEASTVLGRIQRELGTAASQLGARTISDLQASSAEVSASTATLVGELDSLSGDISDRLGGTNDAALRALQGSVGEVKTLLGDPRAASPDPVRDQRSGCTLERTSRTRNTTVMGELASVSGQLTALAEATGACRGTITADLARTVGTVAEDGSCAPAGSAACLIQGVGSALDQRLVQLVDFRDSLADRFDETLVTDVVGSMQTLSDAMADLQQRTNGIGGGTGTVDDELDQELAALESTLTDALTVLAPAGGGVSTADELTTTAGELRAAASALGSALGERPTGGGLPGDTAAEQVLAIRDLACAVPEGEAPTAEDDQISVLAVGVDCAAAVPADGAYDPVSLAGRLSEVAAVEASLTGSADRIDQVVVALGPVTGAVQDALADVQELSTADSPSLSKKVRELVCAVQALSAGADTLPAECSGGQPTAPLDALQTAVDAVETNQAGLTDAEIRAAFDAATSLLETTADEAGTNAGAVADAGTGAADRVGGLIDRLEHELDDSGRDVLTDGRAVVRGQRHRLDAGVLRAQEQLAEGVSRAVRAIDADVSASNRNIRASERRLLADLRKVLVDLGERRTNGSGLLGSLVTGATSTGVSHQQIGAATQAADAFRTVRSQGLDGLLLQQAQTSLALQRQAEFPVFGIELPAGSTHTTVFSIRVGV